MVLSSWTVNSGDLAFRFLTGWRIRTRDSLRLGLIVERLGSPSTRIPISLVIAATPRAAVAIGVVCRRLRQSLRDKPPDAISKPGPRSGQGLRGPLSWRLRPDAIIGDERR